MISASISSTQLKLPAEGRTKRRASVGVITEQPVVENFTQRRSSVDSRTHRNWPSEGRTRRNNGNLQDQQ